MKWSTNKAEYDRRREAVPKDTILNIMTATVPADINKWLTDKASERGVPKSWVVTEVLKRGIEAIELSGCF